LKREILINGSQRETRVAILEDDRLVELLIDRPDHRRTVGDIYLGRVEAVLPGIQAAFVDIGQEKSAFLHASDLLEPEEDEDPEEEEVEEPAVAEAGAVEVVEGAVEGSAPDQKPPWRSRDRRRRRNNGPGNDRAEQGERRQREISSRRPLPNIQDILKKGQTLPVQVTKEPIGTKGCRVTAQISLPGRFLVYMPYASKVGVSRKIESREQRAKLRDMVSKLLPKDAGGVIVRTVAEGVTEEHFRREIDSLLASWKKINR
jgi:ribonuclease G